MKKSSKILLGIILALIFIIACGVAGFLKANHPKPIANKSTNTTKSVGKTNSKSTTNVSQPSIKSQTTDNNFSKTPWTAQSALDFLQKVNDSSSAGERVVGEKYAKYLSSSDAGNFPGNSIFLLENNRSGVGDGGVVLTKNADNTVTLTIGEGAGSSPILKAVIDANTYKVISQSQIYVHNQESMWEYFGIKEPGENQTNKDDSASNDNYSSDDKQSNNDDTSSDNQDNSSTNDTNSDSNNDNSQNSDTKQSNDDSNNNN